MDFPCGRAPPITLWPWDTNCLANGRDGLMCPDAIPKTSAEAGEILGGFLPTGNANPALKPWDVFGSPPNHFSWKAKAKHFDSAMALTERICDQQGSGVCSWSPVMAETSQVMSKVSRKGEKKLPDRTNHEIQWKSWAVCESWNPRFSIHQSKVFKLHNGPDVAQESCQDAIHRPTTCTLGTRKVSPKRIGTGTELAQNIFSIILSKMFWVSCLTKMRDDLFGFDPWKLPNGWKTWTNPQSVWQFDHFI